jgi:hypothetical protein
LTLSGDFNFILDIPCIKSKNGRRAGARVLPRACLRAPERREMVRPFASAMPEIGFNSPLCCDGPSFSYTSQNWALLLEKARCPARETAAAVVLAPGSRRRKTCYKFLSFRRDAPMSRKYLGGRNHWWNSGAI